MAAGPTILWLVRAGDTQWEREARLHGRADLPLTAESRSAIISELAQFGPGASGPRALAAVFHPPDEGATETAAIVARATGSRARPSKELADPDLGLLDGMAMHDFEERYPSRHRQWVEEPLSLAPPEGEPFALASGRILGAMGQILRKHRRRECAVVLHACGLGFARCALAARPGRDLWRMLEGRPRFERYLVPEDVEERLSAEQ